MKIKTFLVALVFAAPLLGGCVDMRIGRPIDSDKIKLIREGERTSNWVRENFGQPLRKTKTDSGEIWVYRHTDGTNVCQELVISFGEDDTVCVYTADGI